MNDTIWKPKAVIPKNIMQLSKPIFKPYIISINFFILNSSTGIYGYKSSTG